MSAYPGDPVTVSGAEWQKLFGMLKAVSWDDFIETLQGHRDLGFVRTATQDQRDMLQSNVSVALAGRVLVMRSDFVRAAGNMTSPEFCMRAMWSGLAWPQPVIHGQNEGEWGEKVLAPSGKFAKHSC